MFTQNQTATIFNADAEKHKSEKTLASGNSFSLMLNKEIFDLKDVCKKSRTCINSHPLDITDLRWVSIRCEECSERYSSEYEEGKPRGV